MILEHLLLRTDCAADRALAPEDLGSLLRMAVRLAEPVPAQLHPPATKQGVLVPVRAGETCVTFTMLGGLLYDDTGPAGARSAKRLVQRLAKRGWLLVHAVDVDGNLSIPSWLGGVDGKTPAAFVLRFMCLANIRED